MFIWEGRNCFFSAAHTDEDIAAVINAVEASVLSLKRAGYFGEASQSDDAAAFPLSHSQQQLLALALTSSDGASAYQLQATVKLFGKLDLARLQQAVTALCRDFPILRFGVDSERLMQYCRVEKPSYMLSHGAKTTKQHCRRGYLHCVINRLTLQKTHFVE